MAFEVVVEWQERHRRSAGPAIEAAGLVGRSHRIGHHPGSSRAKLRDGRLLPTSSLQALADEQLKLGTSVMIDAVNAEEEGQDVWRALASKQGLVLTVRLVMVSDRALHKPRHRGAGARSSRLGRSPLAHGAGAPAGLYRLDGAERHARRLARAEGERCGGSAVYQSAPTLTRSPLVCPFAAEAASAAGI